ncbi:hypothetical protein HDU93_001011 [Gonapodya sp. JEL0774]|nr:hypothetical protein HDU93_001011 [Gonapodya sp. JEL0774]
MPVLRDQTALFVQIAGPIVIVVIVLVTAPARQSPQFVFTTFENYRELGNQGFSILLGLTVPAWSMYGYDAAAHVSEETVNAYKDTSKGVMHSVAACSFLGFFLIVVHFNMFVQSSFPITAANFNYASVAVLTLTLFASISWVVSARRWYIGPITRITEDEITQMELSMAAAKNALKDVGAIRFNGLSERSNLGARYDNV